MGELAEILVHGQPFGHRVVRQAGLAQFQGDVAAPGDLHAVLDGLGNIAEQLAHFLRTLQVLLVGVVARAARIVQGATLVDANPHLVGLELI